MKVPRKKEINSVTLCLGVRYKQKGDNRTKQEDEKVKCLLLGNFLKLIGNRNAFLKQKEKRSKQNQEKYFGYGESANRYLLTASGSLCLLLPLKIQ